MSSLEQVPAGNSEKPVVEVAGAEVQAISGTLPASPEEKLPGDASINDYAALNNLTVTADSDNNPWVNVEHGNHRISIGNVNRASTSVIPEFDTVIRSACTNGDDFYAYFSGEDWATKIPDMIQMGDEQIGDQAFDGAVELETTDIARLKEILASPGIKDEIVSFTRSGSVQLETFELEGVTYLEMIVPGQRQSALEVDRLKELMGGIITGVVATAKQEPKG